MKKKLFTIEARVTGIGWVPREFYQGNFREALEYGVHVFGNVRIRRVKNQAERTIFATMGICSVRIEENLIEYMN